MAHCSHTEPPKRHSRRIDKSDDFLDRISSILAITQKKSCPLEESDDDDNDDGVEPSSIDLDGQVDQFESPLVESSSEIESVGQMVGGWDYPSGRIVGKKDEGADEDPPDWFEESSDVEEEKEVEEFVSLRCATVVALGSVDLFSIIQLLFHIFMLDGL